MRRKIFLEGLAKKLTTQNVDRRATEFENYRAGLHKNVINAIEATERKIIKKRKLDSQKRAKCCFCIQNGSNNRYSSVCDSCKKHICDAHAIKIQQIACIKCNISQ